MLGGLLRAVATRYPVTDIAGHEHVAPGRKLDPGAGFDWARARAAYLGQGVTDSPSQAAPALRWAA